MKKLIFSLSSLLFLFTASNALAVDPTLTPTGGVNINITQPSGVGISAGESIGNIIGNLITIVFSIAALVVLIMIIWGGLEWIFSAGDKEKIGHARDRIIHALVGLALIALAFLLAKTVGTLINVNLLNLHLPALGSAP